MKRETVDEYMKRLDENGMKAVTDFNNFMKSSFPDLFPKISFSMPMWWAGEKMYDGYVGISVAQKHFSIHFHSEEQILQMKQELRNCRYGKQCVKIQYNDEASITLVKKYVMAYMHSLRLHCQSKEPL